MSFFKQFPIIKYDTFGNDVTKDTVDIFRQVDVDDSLIDSISTYTYYEIKDGERPDTVSSRLYGTSDYHWTFFVANESLKEGLNSWPLSHTQFNEWISESYDEYSVIVFVPSYVSFNGGETAEYYNYFGGLDLTNVVITDNNGHTAEIKKFDIQSLQLWIHNISNLNFLESNVFKLCHKENIHDVGSDEYAAFEDVKQSWFKSVFDWCGKNHQLEYEAFLDSDEFLPTDYEAFYENYFVNILFTSTHVFAKSYNAPKFHLNTDGDVISTFTAFDTSFDDSIINIAPYYRSSLDENSHPTVGYTSNGLTDVVDDYYTNTYSIGSYELYISLSSTVSYLEYEEELNFEKRKIRIIRKEIINDFVERYRELIKL